MDKEDKKIEKTKKKSGSKKEKETIEKKIDDEIEQSFPASDPPSYSQPGNSDIEDVAK